MFIDIMVGRRRSFLIVEHNSQQNSPSLSINSLEFRQRSRLPIIQKQTDKQNEPIWNWSNIFAYIPISCKTIGPIGFLKPNSPIITGNIPPPVFLHFIWNTDDILIFLVFNLSFPMNTTIQPPSTFTNECNELKNKFEFLSNVPLQT